MIQTQTINVAYLPNLSDGVDPHLDSNSIHGYYLRHLENFKDAGINLILNGDPLNCEIAWIGNHLWNKKVELYRGLPLIQEQVVDSTWLNHTVRSVLQEDDVIGVTKGGVLRDLSLYNGAGFEDSYHSRLIAAQSPASDGENINDPDILLDESQLQKLIPGPGFLHIGRHTGFFKWAEQNIELATGGGDRPYTCNFVGSVEFRYDTISEHRKLAARIVEGIDHSLYIGAQSRTSDNWVNKSEYLQGLRKSKVCVSPWGYGERCHRDYEAILSGCVLVKPCSSHVVMYPDMFDPSKNYYVPCKLDFSDLEEIIEEININWEAYQDMRVRAYQLMMDSIKPEYAVNYICDEIKDRYSRYVSTETLTKAASL